MNTRNYVKLTGSVIRMQMSKTYTELAIATSGAGNETQYPTVVSYNPLPNNLCKIGARVEIEAHIQVHVIRDRETGKASFFQDLVVDSIKQTKRILSDYVEGIDPYNGGVKDDEDLCLIFGEVTHVYTKGNNFAIVNISVPREENPEQANQCSATCFRRQAAYAAKLEKGDCVAAAGYIQTRDMRNTEGRRQVRQSFVCNDIIKVDGFDDLKKEKKKTVNTAPEVPEKKEEKENVPKAEPVAEDSYEEMIPQEELQDEPAAEDTAYVPEENNAYSEPAEEKRKPFFLF